MNEQKNNGILSKLRRSWKKKKIIDIFTSNPISGAIYSFFFLSFSFCFPFWHRAAIVAHFDARLHPSAFQRDYECIDPTVIPLLVTHPPLLYHAAPLSHSSSRSLFCLPSHRPSALGGRPRRPRRRRISPSSLSFLFRASPRGLSLLLFAPFLHVDTIDPLNALRDGERLCTPLTIEGGSRNAMSLRQYPRCRYARFNKISRGKRNRCMYCKRICESKEIFMTNIYVVK